MQSATTTQPALITNARADNIWATFGLCFCVCTDPAVTELLSSQDNDSTLLPWNPTESVRRDRETEGSTAKGGKCISALIRKVQSRCHSWL